MKTLFLEFTVDGHRGGEIYHERLHQILKAQLGNLSPDTLPRLPESANSAWKRMQYALELCRRETPDLIVSDISSASRNILAVRHTLKRGGRLLLIAQSVPSSRFVKGWIKRLITARCERYLIKHAETVVCNSRFTCDSLGEAFHSTQKTIIAPPGLQADSSDKDPVRKLTSPLRLLFVGECSRVKGLIYLIEALGQLKDNDIQLDVVGGARQEPFYHKQVQNLIAKLDLGDRVTFSGFADRDALNEKYRGASALVVPSLVEGYGMVVAEAFRFGLPVIASNAGALPELVTHELNGLLVPPADSDALAIAIKRLCENEALYGQLSRGAIESAKKLPTWDDFERALTAGLAASGI